MINEKLINMLPKLNLPQLVVSGTRSSSILSTLDPKQTLVITSKTFSRKQDKALKQFALFDMVTHTGEPSFASYAKLKKTFPKKSYDTIVAIGGGSVLDISKVAKKDLRAQLIAIPTTIGSGAEVSQYAVLVQKERKAVISSRQFIPDVVLLNPSYCYTIPKKDLIFQAIDAFAHALEGLVSKMANPLSDMLAIMALDSLYESLISLSKNDSVDQNVISALQHGALFAGIVQGNVGTGIAHSFAHYYGPKLGISHAQAVSIFLIDSIELNMEKTDKYDKLSQTKSLKSEHLIETLNGLYVSLRLTSKASYNDERNPDEVIRDICTISNPIRPTKEQIQHVEDVVFE